MFYRARYLDPSIGRFTSRDPSGFASGINLYAYVNGNPVNFNDPSGLIAKVLLADATSAISYAGNTLTTFGQDLKSFAQTSLDAGRNESFGDTANKLLQGLGPEVAMVGAAVGRIKAVVTGSVALAAGQGGEVMIRPSRNDPYPNIPNSNSCLPDYMKKALIITCTCIMSLFQTACVAESRDAALPTSEAPWCVINPENSSQGKYVKLGKDKIHIVAAHKSGRQRNRIDKRGNRTEQCFSTKYAR